MSAPIERFSDEYRWLSNFAPVEVRYNGITFPTVEHAYQAQKSITPGWAQYIRDCETPGQAKRAGATCRNWKGDSTLRSDWDAVRVPIMEWLLREKFRQEPYRSLLLATGDAEIVEGNTWGDKFWGVVNGEGENRLGKMIMTIREELRAEQR